MNNLDLLQRKTDAEKDAPVLKVEDAAVAAVEARARGAEETEKRVVEPRPRMEVVLTKSWRTSREWRG